MSVRIYQLSKQIGINNSDLIKLLKKRGYDVKSASSTIDNISAESLVDEFSKTDSNGEVAASNSKVGAPEEKSAEAQPPAKPTGAIVRSREDIEKERQRQEQAERHAQMAAPPARQPTGPGAPGKLPPPPPGRAPALPGRGVSRSGGPPPPPGGQARFPMVKTAAQVEAEKKEAEARRRAEQQAKSAPAPAKKAVVELPAAQKEASKPPSERAPEPKPAASKPAGPSAPPPPRVANTSPRPMAPPPRGGPPLPLKEEAPTAPVETTAPAELRAVQLRPPIVVRDFAVMIGKKPFQLISELMEMGIFASMNQIIEPEVAVAIAERHGVALEIRHRGESQDQQQKKKDEPKPVDESKLLEPRPPVVCILGHVDHGKTTLLDTIRHANVVAGEAGGITQHVGAYQVEHNEKKITFIDTPGHAAFSNMRMRGANTTDIAVLVVAADDGFMPQTLEALKHARNAQVPVVVAINKMDAPGANVDKVRRQMMEHDLTPEELGGETLSVPISALKGDGIDDLLEAILLQAEVMEDLTANPNGKVEGVVIEAQKEIGRGSTASAIIQSGTLKPGDALVAGPYYCRVRSLIDDKGKQIKSAPPSTPVKIVGWSGPPDAGETFYSVKNEREAKRMAEDNAFELKREHAQDTTQTEAASVEDLFAKIAQTQQKSFRVIVKADVYGTAEALAIALEQIESEKISLEVVEMGVGAISKNDVIMADAASASIVAFNVGPDTGVAPVAKHHSVRIFEHNIIYELIDLVKDAMADELEPELRENKLGVAEVRAVFPLSKGIVAGCMVTEGRIARDRFARLLRKGELVQSSRVQTLKRFKDDVNEVRAGFECGIRLTDFDKYEEGDQIECFEVEKVKAQL